MNASSSSKRYWLAWLLVPMVLAAAALATAWLLRATLAELAFARYCASKELSCSADMSIPSLQRVIAENGTIRSRTSASGLKVGRTEIELSWPGLFKPQVLKVNATRPVLNVAYRDDAVDLGGLERLLGGAGGGPAPEIRIVDGLVVIDTAAGILTGQVSAEGQFPNTGSFEARFEPTRMRALTNEIVLDAGHVAGAFDAGKLSATLDFQMDALRLGRTAATKLNVRMETRAEKPDQIDWSVEAGSLARRDISIEQLKVSGRAGTSLLSTDGARSGSIWRGIMPLQVSGTSGKVEAGQYQSESSAFALSATAEADRDPGLSAEIDMFGLSSPQGEADDLILTYEGLFEPGTLKVAGSGNLIATGVAIERAYLRNVESLLAGDGLFAAHRDRLRTLLRATLSDFSLSADYRLDADALPDWQLIVSRTLALRGENEVTAVLEPGAHAPVLTLGPGQATLSGLASLTGPNAPKMTLDLRQLRLDESGMRLVSGGARLNPWTVSGTSVGFGLTQLNLGLAGNGLTLSSFGELTLNGELLGVDLRGAKLFGGIDAVRDDAGLRVQTLEDPCIGLQIDLVRMTETLEIPELGIAICPPEGRLIETMDRAFGGRFAIAQAEVPLRGSGFSGDAGMAGLRVSWQVGERLELDLRADRLEFPMLIGDRSVLVEGRSPRILVGFKPQPTLTAEIRSVSLDGNLIPADVEMDRMAFDGLFADGGLQGDITAPGILVRDRNPDPLFETLNLDASVRLDGRRIWGNSPVSLAERGDSIGQARFDLDLLSLTGEAFISSTPLQFEPGGLQPKHISDRTRGLFSNASGSMNANATLNIDQGILSGTGEVIVEDLGFDTLRLGRVTGVNGSIAFDNILDLSTPPSQRVTIDRLEPGLPLVDGEILFQLQPDGEARLEQASWPLAGGRLVVDPTIWTLSGRRDTVTVNAVEIELSDLVEILSLPDLEAEGTVSGSFPIVFEQGNVLIRDARLVADESGGVLRYTGRTVDPASAADPRVGAAFNALRDFRFSVLAVGLDGNLIGKMVLTVDLLGFNPEVLEGAPFKFRISIDSELVQLIEQGRRAATTDWLARAVVVGDGTEDDKE